MNLKNAIVLLTIMTLVNFPMCGENNNTKTDSTAAFSPPANVSGWELVSSPEKYDRQTIFDYIDGAGEVYLAYGFKEVSVCFYNRAGYPSLTVEIFDMGNSGDAYGVFSYAREGESEGIGGGYEYRGSLLSFWQDRFYICLLADEKTEETESVQFELAREISKRLPDKNIKPSILNLLPQENIVSNNIRYIHTYGALNYFYFLGELNLFNLNDKTNALLAEVKSGKAKILLVQYENGKLSGEAKAKFKRYFLPEAGDKNMVNIRDKGWVAVESSDKYLIVVLDAESERLTTDLINKIAEKISQNKP